jgi:trimeric autotransporter adhesin
MASITVTVDEPALESIAIAPEAASIQVGTTQQFVATGGYADGSSCPLPSNATWQSSASGVATIEFGGVATGVGAGTTTVSASMAGVTGTAQLTVIGVPLFLVVTPAAPLLAPGGLCSVQFTATLSGGTTSEDVTSLVTWTTEFDTLVTVSASGLATSVGPEGTTTVTATYDGRSGTAVATVGGGTVASISVTPAAASIAPGATQQYLGTVTLSSGISCDSTDQLTWQSSAPTVASISATALATAGADAGSTTITASGLDVVSEPVTLTVE